VGRIIACRLSVNQLGPGTPVSPGRIACPITRISVDDLHPGRSERMLKAGTGLAFEPTLHEDLK
jgi:hypothetical protein